MATPTSPSPRPAPTEPAAPNADEPFLGQPHSLFTLFFVEMWERFSYYGMRALLVFYMTKGFLGYEDARAYRVYGAYTALVYATPFIGGILADRLMGQRRAVILGGLLMAAGHLLMTIEQPAIFYTALAFLIVGNGFFKPNISTMVGSLYPEGSPKRDGGFTIFYMGINLGAALSPLLCGYVGETWGWHYGFGLATLGMLAGLATFVAPAGLARALIGITAIATVAGMVWLGRDAPLKLAVNMPVGIGLLVAAALAVAALARGGLPARVGAARHPEAMHAAAFPQLPWLSRLGAVYLAVAVAIPAVAACVYFSSVAGMLLAVFGGAALLRLFIDACGAERRERERLFVVLILMFFSMLFWACFEQAGSSLNTFADRNVNRTVLGEEMPASLFQAVNPICILLFGLAFTMLWGFLARRGLDPSTPVKFALGILQMGLGFGVLWLGTRNASAAGLVSCGWLLLAYLLQTTGELCLSPVGLSMVTKLSPARMVSTVMGAWFLATAFSNYLAGMIATLTGADHGGSAADPVDGAAALAGFGRVFGTIAISAVATAAVLFALSPLLVRWMHGADKSADGHH
jgi:POT family proton-dependent oligopeptide transporter